MKTNQELLDQINDLKDQVIKLKQKKKYGLVWENKPEIFEEKSQNALPVLVEKGGKFKDIISDEDKDFNILIEGDNYHSLSVLKYTHRRKIDVIYIDPPYNTGNKDFIYNDNIVDKEDTFRHSKWLSFMNKRLKIAKDLLNPSGVIFISIDDNEFAQLKILCDLVFGEKNFVDCISWDKKSSAKGVPPVNMIVNVHEYILVYQKSSNFSFIGEPRDSSSFKNPDNDPRGPWRNTNIKSTTKNSSDVFTIQDPDTGNEFTDTWAYSRTELQRLINEKYILFPSKKNGQVRRKEFLLEFKNENQPIKSSLGLFDNQKNTEMLKDMLNVTFLNPKPVNLIKYLLKVSTKKDTFILDFFAGSGTTGHAVLELNKEDNGNRKFILCTNNENKICEDVTYKRIEKVSQGYKNKRGRKVKGLGGNLKYLMTDFVKLESSIDDLKEKIVDASTQILCLKESTFKEKYNQEKIKIFESKDKYTAILFDTFYLDDFIKILNKYTDKNVSIYVFTYDKDFSKEELPEISPKLNYTIEPIPEKLLETYQEIFNF